MSRRSQGRIIWVLIALLIPVGGVLGWLALTVSNSFVAENLVTQEVEELSKNPALSKLEIKPVSFQRGLFASDSVIQVKGVEADKKEGPALKFNTRIFHGPVILGAGAPRLSTSYAETKVDWKALGEQTAALVEKAFHGKEPVELHSSIGLEGTRSGELILNPGTLDEKGQQLSFGGGKGRFEIGNGLRAVSGEFRMEALQLKSGEAGGAEVTMKPGHLKVDYAEGRLLKAEGKWGEVAVSGPEKSRIEMGPASFRGDFARMGKDIELLAGQGEFSIPTLRFEGNGESVVIQNLRIRTEVKEEKPGKISSLFRYEVGSVDTGSGQGKALAALPPELVRALKGPASFEAGTRGVDARKLASLQRSLREFQETQANGAPSGKPGLEALTNEQRNLLRKGLDQFLELVEPDTAIYAQSGAGGGAFRLDLSLGMGGTKKLRELASIRELASALTGELNVFLRRGLIPEEQAQAMLGAQVQAGLVTAGPDGYAFQGALKGGQLLLGGKPTPLLEMLAPVLNQPIPWETLYKSLEPKKP